MSTAIQIDETMLATLGAIVVLITKLLDLLLSWLIKQLSPAKAAVLEKVAVVQLDPEVSRMIRSMHDTLNSKDNDGVPHVFFPRSMGENVTTIAACMRDVSSSQERIVEGLERLDGRIDKLADKVDRN